jgi:plasmid stabilization system protein ParE
LSNTAFTESVVESAALAWLEAIAWQIAHDQGHGAALGATAELRRTFHRFALQPEARG